MHGYISDRPATWGNQGRKLLVKFGGTVIKFVSKSSANYIALFMNVGNWTMHVVIYVCQIFASNMHQNEYLQVRFFKKILWRGSAIVPRHSVHEWMSSNRLSLNTGKTQFIWLGTKHSLAKRETDRLLSLLPSLTELTSVRNLGFIIDQELNMKDHITKLCQSCYYQLRQIRTVRNSLTSSAIQTLVHAFICTRVDFSNSLLYGTSAIQMYFTLHYITSLTVSNRS